MWESILEALKILAPIGGWVFFVIMFVLWYEQRKENRRLREVSEVLRRHDKERREKDKIRDKILRDLMEIVSDEKMSKENREKIAKQFKALDKPWTNETHD